MTGGERERERERERDRERERERGKGPLFRLNGRDEICPNRAAATLVGARVQKGRE